MQSPGQDTTLPEAEQATAQRVQSGDHEAGLLL